MDYEITFDTQTILPIDENTSKIVDGANQYIVKSNALEVIERSCEYFGSSYEGRKLGTKALLGITHKSPIIVEESRKIIFFPTKSPDRTDCIWINLSQIQNYYKIDDKRSTIVFKNGDGLDLNISFGSLNNQILRASRLRHVLEERQESKKDIIKI